MSSTYMYRNCAKPQKKGPSASSRPRQRADRDRRSNQGHPQRGSRTTNSHPTSNSAQHASPQQRCAAPSLPQPFSPFFLEHTATRPVKLPMTRSEAREEGLKRKLEDMGRRTAEAVKTCVRDIPDHAGRVCGKLADAVFEAPLAMGEVCRMIQVSVVDLSADCGEGWRRCLERV